MAVLFAVDGWRSADSTLSRPRDRLLRDLGAGWREICRHDWLRAGILAATIYHIANGALLVLTQVVIIRQLGSTRSVWSPQRGSRRGERSVPRHAHPTVPAVAQRLDRAADDATVGSVVRVAGDADRRGRGRLPRVRRGLYFDVAWETAIQDQMPHGLLARVASWDTLTSFVAMPLGSALAGPLANGLGIRAVLAGCAVVLTGASLAPLATAGTRHLAPTEAVPAEPAPYP